MLRKSAKAIPFPCISGAYILISAAPKEKHNFDLQGPEVTISFFFDGGSCGAEWEPEFGPITRITSCGKDDEGAVPHIIYDCCTGYGN